MSEPPSRRSAIPLSLSPSAPPTSVFVYARNRRDLDGAVAEVAHQVGEGGVWIEVREPGPEGPDEAWDSSVTGEFYYRLELEPADLLPEPGLEHLARWVAGRSQEPSLSAQEGEDLAWLAPPLRSIARSRTDESRVLPVVVARGDRLVLLPRFDREDVARLVGVLKRHRITLIVGSLIRPMGGFAELFDYVVRVRPAPEVGSGVAPFLIERRPEPSAASDGA